MPALLRCCGRNRTEHGAVPFQTRRRRRHTLPGMDPRWQPNLGPLQPAAASPEACDLHAAGWGALPEECWVRAGHGAAMLVSLETWRALRDRAGFVRPRLAMQRP